MPVASVGCAEEGEGLEEGVVVVLVEPQHVHDHLLAVRSHRGLQVLLRLGKCIGDRLRETFRQTALLIE